MKIAVSLIATLTFMIAPVIPPSVDQPPEAAPAYNLCHWYRWLPLCPR